MEWGHPTLSELHLGLFEHIIGNKTVFGSKVKSLL